MNTTYREFDTDSTSTPPSRSVRIARNVSGGFTLIELMVVISIIALLSTVVLAAMGDAKTKGRNTAKNEYVKQAVNALELYRSSNASYPSFFGSDPLQYDTTHYACLGFAAGENCFGIYNIDGDASFNSALATYYGGTMPKNSGTVTAGAAGDLNGVLYRCQTSSCDSYSLVWHLEKTSQTCPLGSSLSSNVGGTTRCGYSN